MKKYAKTLALGALVASSVLAGSAAFATGSVISQEVVGGNLIAFASDVALSPVKVSHTDTRSSGVMTLNVDDTTGTGNGWVVSQQLSDLKGSSGNAIGHTISATGFTAVPGILTTIAGQDAAGITSARVASLNEMVAVLVAPPGSGIGAYELPITLELTVPADTYAGAYSGTMTTTIAPNITAAVIEG